MVPRMRMVQEMESINGKIIDMANQVESDILLAIKALEERDVKLAAEIIDNGDKVDDMEEEIQQECFKFLATQAPIGSDLRYCISIMKMVRDLERIGDHTEDLAKYVQRLEERDYGQELVHLPRMAEFSAKMVSNAIEAFLNQDLRLARRVWKADEEVDELFRIIYNKEMLLANQGGGNADVYLMFAFVAAHLERISDYATNICEETVFYLQGEAAME